MAKAQTQTGSKAIRAIFEDAKRAVDDSNSIHDPDPNLARDGVLPGRWDGYPGAKWPGADLGCHVRIIGRDASGTVYLTTSTNDMRAVEKFDHARLMDIFAPYSNTIKFLFPAWGKQKVTDPHTEEVTEKMVVKRVERDLVVEAIYNEAARRPLFDPNSQHRGRGGWQDSQGNFIWHSGSYLWVSDGKRLERSRPAVHDNFLYTRMPTTIEPWQEPVSQEESPARRILDDLCTWNWQRPYLDPILVLGWLGVALMGGALKARPILFCTGGAGVGKSTLMELLRSVLAGAVTTTVNTTAAGIYQKSKLDSLAFLIDELESKPGSTRAEAVIELMRVAYTGGDISRGGQDHEATTFTARNAFGGFAINVPPLGAQDKTRMAILNLQRLDAMNGIGRAVRLSIETDGRMILRQIMDGWKAFQGDMLQYYWEELAPHGLDSRAIDTFGTLLASAELLVGREALEKVGLPMGEVNRVGEVVAAATRVERSENLDNWHKCLDHLFQSSVEAWRDGVRPTIGSVVEALLTDGKPYPHSLNVDEARERLRLVGLGVVARDKIPGKGPMIAIPGEGPQLQRIFGDTEFQKGVWFSALKQAPPDVVLRDLGNAQKVKINGNTKHCLLIDLESFERFASKVE